MKYEEEFKALIVREAFECIQEFNKRNEAANIILKDQIDWV